MIKLVSIHTSHTTAWKNNEPIWTLKISQMLVFAHYTSQQVFSRFLFTALEIFYPKFICNVISWIMFCMSLKTEYFHDGKDHNFNQICCLNKEFMKNERASRCVATLN